MTNINTTVSYTLRFVVALHASFLATLFFFQKPTMPPRNSVLILTMALGFLILVLLVVDWATRKDQSRRFSKSIDAVVGIGWTLAILVAVLRSISMGTL